MSGLIYFGFGLLLSTACIKYGIKLNSITGAAAIVAAFLLLKTIETMA